MLTILERKVGRIELNETGHFDSLNEIYSGGHLVEQDGLQTEMVEEDGLALRDELSVVVEDFLGAGKDNFLETGDVLECYLWGKGVGFVENDGFYVDSPPLFVKDCSLESRNCQRLRPYFLTITSKRAILVHLFHPDLKME